MVLVTGGTLELLPLLCSAGGVLLSWAGGVLLSWAGGVLLS
jgi:hypothetical protein